MKIHINLSNKTFYLLVSFLGLLTISAIVFAYGGNNPSVHGHDAGELEGLSGGNDRKCIFVDSISEGAEFIGKKEVSLLIDGENICDSVHGCEMAIWSTTNTTYYARTMGRFYEIGTGSWNFVYTSTSGVTTGINGDATDTNIFWDGGAGNGCLLYDDMSDTENDPNKFTFFDNRGGWQCSLSICRRG
jgi:hypothetical protein